MFMESTSIACTPDAVLTNSGGQWQGFALGASEMECNTITKEFSGKLETYSQIQIPLLLVLQAQRWVTPHALDRTITITLSDNGVYDTGIQTSPVPDLTQ